MSFATSNFYSENCQKLNYATYHQTIIQSQRQSPFAPKIGMRLADWANSCNFFHFKTLMKYHFSNFQTVICLLEILMLTTHAYWTVHASWHHTNWMEDLKLKFKVNLDVTLHWEASTVLIPRLSAVHASQDVLTWEYWRWWQFNTQPTGCEAYMSRV